MFASYVCGLECDSDFTLCTECDYTFYPPFCLTKAVANWIVENTNSMQENLNNFYGQSQFEQEMPEGKNKTSMTFLDSTFSWVGYLLNKVPRRIIALDGWIKQSI